MPNLRRSFLGLTLALGLGLYGSAASAQTATATTTTTVTVPAPPPVSSTSVVAASAPRTDDGRVTAATADIDTEIRQREEQSRIDSGVRSGTIDAREAANLTRAMAGLQAYQERAYADGVLTLREQARLARLHARIDRGITRAIAR
jgi:hypothetical protein